MFDLYRGHRRPLCSITLPGLTALPFSFMTSLLSLDHASARIYGRPHHRLSVLPISAALSSIRHENPIHCRTRPVPARDDYSSHAFGEIGDGAVRVMVEINETSGRSLTDSTLHWSFRRCAQRGVDFICAGVTLGGEAEIDSRHIGRRHTNGRSVHLPFRCGSTSPTDRAAPVEVGIIDMAAARARRRSLWLVSSVGWSPV